MGGGLSCRGVRLAPSEPVPHIADADPELQCVDNFGIQRILGYGGYGVVLLVCEAYRDGKPVSPPEAQQQFAVKVQNTEQTMRTSSDDSTLKATVAPPATLVQREQSIYHSIWNEPDSSGRIGHPFVVELLCSISWSAGQRWRGVELPRPGQAPISRFQSALVMEYCSQGSLHDFTARHFRNGEDDKTVDQMDRWFIVVREFSAQILCALDFLHNRTNPIIYRDMSPGNVLISGSLERPHVKLGDFGFSKFINRIDPPASIAGTLYFASPDMGKLMKGEIREVTVATDVWSFSRVLFVMAFGCDFGPRAAPVGGQGWVSACEKQQLPNNQALRMLTALDRCGPPIVDVIQKAKTIDAAHRPSVPALQQFRLFHEVKTPSGAVLPAIDWDRLRRG